MRKGYHILIAFGFSIAMCSCEEGKPTIVPLKQFDSEERKNIEGTKIFCKGENFIIENYKDLKDLKDIEVKVDSIALSKWNSGISKYDDYAIFFFKESDETNIEALKANPRNMYRYSQDRDLVYWFRWSKGEFMGKMKFKNGRELKNDDSRFENGPTDKFK